MIEQRNREKMAFFLLLKNLAFPKTLRILRLTIWLKDFIFLPLRHEGDGPSSQHDSDLSSLLTTKEILYERETEYGEMTKRETRFRTKSTALPIE